MSRIATFPTAAPNFPVSRQQKVGPALYTGSDSVRFGHKHEHKAHNHGFVGKSQSWFRKAWHNIKSWFSSGGNGHHHVHDEHCGHSHHHEENWMQHTKKALKEWCRRVWLHIQEDLYLGHEWLKKTFPNAVKPPLKL